MKKHINLLGLLYLIYGALGLVSLLIMLALFLVGSGLAAADNPRAGLVIGTLGAIVVLITALASLPNVFAGYGLVKFRNWGRILALILSFLNLPAFPLGTALGIYGIWVLLHGETVRIFQGDHFSYASPPS
jgi:hypothetical protein